MKQWEYFVYILINWLACRKKNRFFRYLLVSSRNLWFVSKTEEERPAK